MTTETPTDTRSQIMALLRNKLTVISGCAQVVEIERRNTPDSRAKGRTIIRVSMELIKEMDELLKGKSCSTK